MQIFIMRVEPYEQFSRTVCELWELEEEYTIDDLTKGDCELLYNLSSKNKIMISDVEVQTMCANSRFSTDRGPEFRVLKSVSNVIDIEIDGDMLAGYVLIGVASLNEITLKVNGVSHKATRGRYLYMNSNLRRL